MNRSGAGSAANPNATRNARCCGSGSAARQLSIGVQSWCSAASGSFISDSTPSI